MNRICNKFINYNKMGNEMNNEDGGDAAVVVEMMPNPPRIFVVLRIPNGGDAASEGSSLDQRRVRAFAASASACMRAARGGGRPTSITARSYMLLGRWRPWRSSRMSRGTQRLMELGKPGSRRQSFRSM
jgi:hypothetical protein